MRESGHGILATPATQTPELRSGSYDNGLVGIESCCRKSWQPPKWQDFALLYFRAPTSSYTAGSNGRRPSLSHGGPAPASKESITGLYLKCALRRLLRFK